MPTQIGIGFSRDPDIEKAAAQAALEAKTSAQAQRIDFALLLSTIHYNPVKTLPIISKILNTKKLIGSSTAGIILSDSIETRGLAVLALSSPDIKFGIGSVANINPRDMHSSGTILAKNSVADFGKHGRQIFIFFTNGLLPNNSALLKGVQEVLGNVFPIVGAGSCDDFSFKETFQIFENRILKNSASGLILGGHVNVGVGGRHGWHPLGRPRVLTKVNNNIIVTIDGKMASSLYEEFFAEEAQKLYSTQLARMAILYPLGIYIEESSEYLLRNAIDILPDGSIVCQGEVPEGARVHIMIGSKDSCKEAAKEAALEAHKNLLGKKANLIFVIESMARLKLLGRSAFNEIKEIKEVFGPDTPLIGMYAYGEICPFQSIEPIKKPYLQNESIVVLAIG